MVARSVIYILTGQNCGHFRRFARKLVGIIDEFRSSVDSKNSITVAIYHECTPRAPRRRKKYNSSHSRTRARVYTRPLTRTQRLMHSPHARPGAIFDQVLLRRLYFCNAADVIAILADKQSGRKPHWSARGKFEVGPPSGRSRNI